jgi:predicted phage terminase large subunit-like protein
MVTRADAAQEIIKRDDARDSLLGFVEYTYPSWRTAEHHRRICAALERVERGEIKRLLIEAPPRHSKSELASRRFPAWYMGRHPGNQIITASYNDLLGTDIGRDVRNIVGSTDYRNVFADVALAEDSAAAGRWHTNKGGSYLATGVGGTMTGYGAHLAIIDDPIKNREESDSERHRDNVWHWYTSTLYTRLMPGGAIVLMMTRWHEDDLAARVQASEHWEIVHLPAITVDDFGAEHALWPEWYPLERLHETRKVLPPRDWQALYQQEPRTELGTFIKREWFRERWSWCTIDKCKLAHAHAPPMNLYICSDFAITEAQEGKDPDYTEHGVFGVGADDKIYVMDWWSGQTTTDVWVDELLRLIKQWKPICWFGEGGVVGKSMQPIIDKMMRERRIYCRTERLAPIHDKATRARSFQGRAHAGMVVFPSTPWAERVINQCVAFPGAAHDDAFDVMAWMGLAVDEAIEAIAPKPKSDKPRDRWNQAFKGTPAQGWKIV